MSLVYLSSLWALPLELTAKFWQFSSVLQVCSPQFICLQAVSPTFSWQYHAQLWQVLFLLHSISWCCQSYSHRQSFALKIKFSSYGWDGQVDCWALWSNFSAFPLPPRTNAVILRSDGFSSSAKPKSFWITTQSPPLHSTVYVHTNSSWRTATSRRWPW